VALVVRLTRTFWRSRAHLIKPGSSTSQKLTRLLAELQHEPVPAETDEQDMLPPVKPCWSRRVPGTALAVMFERRGEEVLVLALRIWP
jgi:Txe/YoeB family toxin of Txe-Axe toxin-antitoxin module